jgi:hypothetical protein
VAKELPGFDDRQLTIALAAGEIVEICDGADAAEYPRYAILTARKVGPPDFVHLEWSRGPLAEAADPGD